MPSMTSQYPYVRHGIGTIRAYVHGHLELWDLVKNAFGAEEIERHEFSPTSFHIEARIGDSVIVLETGDPPAETGSPSSIYVYVPDVDAAYRRAIERGAISVAEPKEQPYQERNAGVKDRYGNTWWISTYRA